MPDNLDPTAARFHDWVNALHERHRETLTFQEIRKGVVALSRIYVEERHRIGGNVFDGAGKRAAFACFYSPLHFLLARHIVTALAAAEPAPKRVLDLGCGLAAAGAAWCLAADREPRLVGVDQSAWAISEARRSLDSLGVRAKLAQGRVERAPEVLAGDGVVLAFTVNELSEPVRNQLLTKLTVAARKGTTVLVIEPIARRTNRWWEAWSAAFAAERGGRADEWRFEQDLPEPIRALDRASGLDHSRLTGRSLFLPGFS